MEYCCREWHSAHLPVAFTNSAFGWSTSLRGRERCTSSAPMIKTNAIKMAMKTDRNDTVDPLLNLARGTGSNADYITDATVRHNLSPRSALFSCGGGILYS